MAEQIHLIGEVESVFFENPQNLYKVLRVKVLETDNDVISEDHVTCTGQFASLLLDTAYEFYGQVTVHPRYGEQFAVSRYQQVAPTSEAGLVEFLSSARFTGIGKTLAQRIVDQLGLEAIDLILQDPDCLKSVKGLTPDKRQVLAQTLRQHQGTERIFLQLTEWGFGPKLADKIYQTFKDQTLATIENNPYALVAKVEGVGFNKADALAEQLGIEADAVTRLVAGLYTAVSEVCLRSGDTYVQRPRLLALATKILERSRSYLIEEERLAEALDLAILEGTLYSLDQGIMLPSLYHAEMGIVRRISDFFQYEEVETFSKAEIEGKLDQVARETGIDYDETQRQAMILALQSPLSVITGGPGTGKTTLIRGILTLHRLLHGYPQGDVTNPYQTGPVLLAAPTGRAAKRMQEMTDIPASTIHRLIGFNRETTVEGFDPTPLEGQLLVVDEMSMVDTWLMNWLWMAIGYRIQVILVGDKHQLPSVGPGKVFSDLIESGVIPTISLTKIYRQAQDSSIIQLAHQIRQGRLPQNLMERQPDRSFIPCKTQQVAQVVEQVVGHALTRGFDANTLQVLAPMYKGPAGITALNQLLQGLFNPPSRKKPQLEYFDQVFRLGDKVLQLVNNAEEGVYNGDIGKIVGVFSAQASNSGSEEVVVAFDDDKELTYRRSDFDQLTLAYCCSVHKSQGSEYPLVILPLVDAYYRMLRQDLLYTAVTRAQSSLVLVGDPDAYVQAVSQDRDPRRTNLKDLLEIKLAGLTQGEKIEQELASGESQVLGLDAEKVEVSATDQASPQVSPAASVSVAVQSRDWIPKQQESFRLSQDLIDQIDPMIGMEGISPYDFESQTC